MLLLLLMVVLRRHFLHIAGHGHRTAVVRRDLRRVAGELSAQGSRGGGLLRVDLLLLGLVLRSGVLGLGRVVSLLLLLLLNGHAAGGLRRVVVLLGLLLGVAAVLDRSGVGLLHAGCGLVLRVGGGIDGALLGGGGVRGGAAAGGNGGAGGAGVAMEAGGAVAVERNGVEGERGNEERAAVECQSTLFS